MTRRHAGSIAIAVVLGFVVAGSASAQESKSAEATRKKLQQKIEKYEAKDVGTKDFLTDILKNEIDKEIRFIVDNGSGVSNNSKLSMKVKDMTVEQVLNEFSDKMDCGWFVESNVGNNRRDGQIVIRKSSKGKERGYEFGKEPKKKAEAPTQRPQQQPVTPIVEAARGTNPLLVRRD